MTLLLVFFHYTYTKCSGEMGSLVGHVLSGSLILLYGLWWIFVSTFSHIKKSTRGEKNLKPRRGNASFFQYKLDQGSSQKSWIPQPCCSHLPLEPIFKIIISAIGFITEEFFDLVQGHVVTIMYSVYSTDGSFSDQGKNFHVTIYSVFLLSGVVDIVSLYVKLPRHTSQLFFALGFFLFSCQLQEDF